MKKETLEEAIGLLKQTTEYEVLQSFRDKVVKLEEEIRYSEEEVPYQQELFDYLENELGVIALTGQMHDIEDIVLNMKPKQVKSYGDGELFKIINDFCFDWNYNYKGELSQKQYLIEWFEKFKNN